MYLTRDIAAAEDRFAEVNYLDLACALGFLIGCCCLFDQIDSATEQDGVCRGIPAEPALQAAIRASEAHGYVGMVLFFAAKLSCVFVASL